ncbi:hypothetical protein E2D57_23740 [Salmonella enterica subsp. enterica serovar Typhimurium]|nr:hypothetical protein [Salmonella enterica subsp. enterica serovar Typhimurium]ECS7453788.1 hypothetical protein [Salmonella enterica]
MAAPLPWSSPEANGGSAVAVRPPEAMPLTWARDGSPKGRDAQRLDAQHDSPVLRLRRGTTLQKIIPVTCNEKEN